MRAILLAAGMGTRLRPITYQTPKSLIKINDKPLLERQIEYLREIGVDEVIVLTGYLAEKFEYLKEKYNVKLVYNDKYDVYNNIYSMYLVREYLADSYVIDADTYLCRNFLEKDINVSTYFTGIKKDFNDEWILRFDEEGRVYDIVVGSGEDYIMSGVSYWTSDDGKFIKDKLEEVISGEDWKELYWDNIARDYLKTMNVHVKKINSQDWFEIDSLDDLKTLQEKI